jgi:hypothetical protein
VKVIDKETVLFKVLSGSHLYGTAGPQSDLDYKAICLPALDNLLLNKKVTNYKEKPEGLKAGDKMVAGEKETEYIPLQVFLDDFFSGQTYALEVAFATAQGLHEFDPGVSSSEGMGVTTQWYFWKENMQRLVNTFTTNNVKKMVGYVVAQSRMYGLKTERYTSIKAFVEKTERYFVETLGLKERAPEMMRKMKLLDAPLFLEELKQLKFVQDTMLANAKGGLVNAPALDVCGKKFPLTNKWETVIASMKISLANYGQRVADFEGEGVDWKALSHAMRITEQVLELSETGSLKFPRPNADFLRAVKNGEMPLDEATAYLETIFSKVDEAVAKSVLQERTPELEEEFTKWKLSLLRFVYNLK